MKELVVTIAIGEKYLDNFNRHFRASQERFAKKIGRDYLVVDDWIENTGKNPSWQKMLLFRHPAVKDYDRVAFFDADIYLTKDAADPFAEVPAGKWGMCPNNPFDSDKYRSSDLTLYDPCPPGPRPAFVLNGGFFILDKTHREMMEKVYFDYPELPCMEQGPLSFALLSGDQPGVVLDHKYNDQFRAYREHYGFGLGTIWRMAKECSGIHFSGGVDYRILRLIKIFEQIPANPAIPAILSWTDHPKVSAAGRRALAFLRRFGVPGSNAR
jgi:hypothetical protein